MKIFFGNVNNYDIYFKVNIIVRLHDTRHNDSQHNDIQHNYTQQNKYHDTEHNDTLHKVSLMLNVIYA